jgi:hypothetical protein
MADGVAITAGSGTTILTDETASGHAQVVKLAYSADGSATPATVDADGVLVNLGTNNDVTVTGTVTANLAAGTNNIGDVDVLSIAAGTNYIGRVRLTDGTTDTQVSTTGALFVGGAVAHDAVDSGNPVKLGARAVAHGANPTAVAAADRTDLFANRHGVLFVVGGHPNAQTIRHTYAASAQTDTAIGPGTVNAGTKVVVTQIQATVSNATTATPAVRVGFGATNTPTGAGVVLSHPGIPGGGGVSRGDGSGILGVGADGEELRLTADAATGGTLDLVVSYYTIES